MTTTVGNDSTDYRVVIVGTGFSGLGAAIRLKEEGIDDFVVLERADDVGGVWRDNTYPGCACDIPSHLYSFSFAPNADWSRAYSPQPEIYAYLRRVAEEYGVLPHVRFRAEMTAARWNDEQAHWEVETPAGVVTGQVLVAGTGALNEPVIPELPGLTDFAGTKFHSAAWNHDHDLTGRRVAVIGTGASAIQFVPQIQPDVDRLVLFQRTAPWVMSRRDHAYSTRRRRLFRWLPLTRLFTRAKQYSFNEMRVIPFTRMPSIMRLGERQALAHLRAQVPDPELRRKLKPDYTLGCKRVLLSDDYYPALTQPNVDVVTDGIREVRADAIVTNDGTVHPVDTIIFGTGFHVTDPPMANVVRGRNGTSLAETWESDGLEAHRGSTVAGFPNFVMLMGPNTGLGHNSQVFMIEAQLSYLLGLVRYLDRSGVAAVDVRRDVQATYNLKLQRRLERTVWNTGGCRSWYLDPRTGKNTTLWPGSTLEFRRRVRRFDPTEYDVVSTGQPERPPVVVGAISS